MEEGSGFIDDAAGIWRETPCIIEERTVLKDNTVAWGGLRLQIPPSRLRPRFVKAGFGCTLILTEPDRFFWVHTGWQGSARRRHGGAGLKQPATTKRVLKVRAARP